MKNPTHLRHLTSVDTSVNAATGVDTSMKAGAATRCVQLNLARSIAATTSLDRQLSASRRTIALIQEPHLTKAGIPNLTAKLNTVAAAPARAALYFSNEIKYLALPSYMTKDMAVANVKTGDGHGFIWT